MASDRVVTITEDEYMELCDEYGGICLSCGHRQHGVEPDAQNYVCENCDEKQVFGVQELLVMGQLILSD